MLLSNLIMMKALRFYNMKIIKSIYQDLNGNIWEVKRESLPKVRGEFVFWIAECTKKNISIRANLKKNIIIEIKKHQT